MFDPDTEYFVNKYVRENEITSLEEIYRIENFASEVYNAGFCDGQNKRSDSDYDEGYRDGKRDASDDV